MPVVVVATITPKPEYRDEVIAAMKKAVPLVHAEDGCELYALHADKLAAPTAVLRLDPIPAGDPAKGQLS